MSVGYWLQVSIVRLCYYGDIFFLMKLIIFYTLVRLVPVFMYLCRSVYFEAVFV